jgi:hypothetical protein
MTLRDLFLRVRALATPPTATLRAARIDPIATLRKD